MRVTRPSPLSDSYLAARTSFIDAAGAAGADMASFAHPSRGLHDEDLSIDVARLGPPDAEDVVVIVSGTHGVEGYCGSAVQSRWLREHAAQRPSHVTVVMIHALNPFGFSWVKRTNEDNVDLNRNFIDWSEARPHTPGYDAIADLLVPAEWTQEERDRTEALLLEWFVSMSPEDAQQIVSGGQYGRVDGVFYGGTEPVWSHRWLRSWCTEHLADARRVAIIDIHTGLGPWGHGELISASSPGSDEFERAARWWGEITSMGDDSVSALISGDWLQAAPSWAPQAEVTPIAIEYGTVDTIAVLQALRADAWLHVHGDAATTPWADEVRAQVRAAFADDDPAWFDAVWPRACQVIEQTFAALRD